MLACVLAVALSIAQPSPGPSLTPGKILANTRLAMFLRDYPRYLTYIIDIQSDAYGRHYHEGYRALLRTVDGSLVVKRTPIYSSNKPINPYGFSFFGLNKVGNPADHIEPPFGVPLMSATYDFGLARAPATRMSNAAEAAAEELSQVPVIGRINVTAGDYDAVLIGEETLDDHPVYHLGLTPLRDSDQNRLRELWVDKETFDVWKLVTEGIFPGGPAASVSWTVNFIHLHGHWLIRTESTSATLTSHPHLFGGQTQYKGVNYTFGAYGFPDYVSDLEFLGTEMDTDAVQM
jgi:hypothetical protein